MSFVLERGGLEPSKREYTPCRLAQSVTYLLKWRQIAVCDEIKPLKQYAKDNPVTGYKYRISGTSNHAGMNYIKC